MHEGAPDEEVPDLPFEKREGAGRTNYIFRNVVVVIDRSGKNYQALPELLFGTYGDELEGNTLEQPEARRENVDMDYVADCIRAAARDSGEKEFWIYPFGDDKPEAKTGREQARLRLFRRYVDIEPEPSGNGYVLKT